MLAHVRDGRIVRVSGDPDHPVTRGSICGKAARYVERIYSPDRVLYPQVRVGPKGSGEFRRLSWDDALALVADRLRRIIDEHGADSVLPYSFAGTMGVVNYSSMDRRFFNCLGASQLARTVCSAAGNAGFDVTVGANRGTDPEATSNARYIVAWGANVVSANMHQMTYIRETQRNGATFVHIDVHRNRTTAFADRFVQIRPGTDAALALGMMHVIVRDGLHDAAYVEASTVGFDGLRTRLDEYPPGPCGANHECRCERDRVARAGIRDHSTGIHSDRERTAASRQWRDGRAHHRMPAGARRGMARRGRRCCEEQ